MILAKGDPGRRTGAQSVLALVKVGLGPQWDGRAGSREEISHLVRTAGGCGFDFILLATDDRLKVVGAWRVARESGAFQGFPMTAALQLASSVGATGLIVVQERDDPIPRRPDIELTTGLRSRLAETGIELLDHLLIAEGTVSACRPK